MDMIQKSKRAFRRSCHDTDNDGIREKDGQKMEFTMPYTNDFGNRDDIMIAIAGQLAEVGISVKQEGMEMLAWLGLLKWKGTII